MSKGEHETPNRATLLEENKRLRERLEKAEKRLQDLRVGEPGERTETKRRLTLKGSVTGPAHDLLQNHQLMEAATEGTDVPIATQDKDLRYTYLNAAYKNMIKRTTGKEPCAGMKMSEVFADMPEQGELQLEEWKQSLQGKRTNQISQLGGHGREAHFYNVLRTPLRDEQGNIVGAAEVAHDVTEQVLTEQALRESEEQAKKQSAELDAIISSLPEAVTIYDRNGRVMRTNKLSEDLLSQAGDESKSQVRILDANGQPVRTEELPYQRALRGETVREESLCAMHEANVPVWISSSAAPIYKDGAVAGAVSITTDISRSRLIEEELRSSEMKYREMIKYAPAGIYEVDFRTRKFVSVNDLMCELTGYSREELMQKSPMDLLDPKSQENFQERMQAWLAGKKPPENVDYTIKKKDGSDLYALLNVTFTRDEKGNPRGATVVGYDITDWKRLEEKLHDNARKYSLLFDGTSDGVSILDLGGRIVEVNEAYCQMSGYSRSELIGMPISILEANETPAEIDAHIEKLIAQGGHDRFETRHRRMDSSIYDVDITMLYLEREGGQVAIFVRDMSERKKAEEQLAYQSVLLDQVNDGVLGADAGTLITYWNKGMEHIFGYSAEEALGQTTVALLKPNYEPGERKKIIGQLDSAGQNKVEIHAHHKDGREIVVEANSTRITDPKGRISGYVAIYRDITENKQANEALRLSEERFRLALKNAPISVAVQDENLHFQWAFNQRTIPSEQIVGKTDHDIFPAEDAKHLIAMKKQVLKTGKEIREKLWITSSGKRVYLDLMLEPLHDNKGNVNGVGITTIDLTAMKRTEEELQKSEERYRKLVELSPDAIYVHRNEKIVLANPAALKVFGATSAEQVLGKSPLDFFHPDFHELIRQRVQKALEGETVPLVEGRIIQLNGAVRNTETTGSLIMEEEGPAIQVILRDITERKKKDEELHNLNRTLTALSNINQAMVRAEDEAGYMDKVCRIVVEDCGHAMVWIGLAEEDDEKNVRPVASAGFEEGYLETLHITWADTERGRGPTGTAIRTGQVSMCRNMLTDQMFAPWRGEALKRGYASSIVLPLMNGNKAFGGITIYSRQPDSFSENEIKLLEELASDLAYGILMLRTRQAHAEAEEALHQSEARFRQLADASMEGIVIHEKGLLLDVNERIPEMLGYTPDELIGKLFWDYIDPKFHEMVLEKVKLDSTEVYEVELIHKDGRRVPVEVMGRMLMWHGKQARVSVVRDITQRKLAEEALRHSEARYRSLFNGMTEGFALHEIICDEQGNPYDYHFLDVNPAFERLTGLKRKDVVGKNYNEVLPNDSARWVEEYGAVALGGEPVHFENYSPALDQYYEVFAYRPAERQFAVIFMNVTERKRAEAALRQSETRLNEQFLELSQIYKSSPVGLFAVDKDMRYLRINELLADINGKPVEEHIGRTIGEVLPELADTMKEALKPVLEEGIPLTDVEISGTTPKKPGMKRYWLANYYPIKAEDGEILGVTGAVMDITERKWMEAELQKAHARAEERASELDTIFNSITDGIIVYDTDGKARQFNQAAVEMLGFDPTDGTIGSLAKALSTRTMDGQPLELANAPSNRALQGETVRGESYKMSNPKGEDMIVVASASPLWLKNRISGAVAVMQDMTERYKAEETQAWLASFPSLNPNPICELELDGRIHYLNPAAQAFFPRLEETGMNHPWLAGMAEILEQFKNGDGTTLQRELQVSKFHFLQTIQYIKDNQRTRIYGVDISQRKQAEESLAVERANLQRIFDVVNVGMLLVNPRGEVKRFNDVVRQWTEKDFGLLMNRQPGDALGCIHALMEPDGCGHTPFCSDCRIRQAFETVLRTGKPVHDVEVETTLVLQGEQKRMWLDISADPLEVDGERHAILAMNDITARKEAEQALVQARDQLEQRVVERTVELSQANLVINTERKRFNDVLEMLPAYLILLTPDYHATFANRFFRERFGEANGRPCYEFLFGRDKPCEVCETYKVLQTNQPLEWEWVGPDKRTYSVHDFPFTDVDGKTLILEMGIDVTEQKQAEAQLRLQTSAMEAAANGIFITDAKGKIQWCNPAFAEMSGYKWVDVIGKNPRFLKSGKHDKAFYDTMWTTLLSGQVWHGEMVNRRKDGSLYFEEQTITPVQDESGKIAHFIAVKQDISARKESEEALRLANAYNRSLLEASLDPLVTITPDGKIGDVNSAAEKVTGRKRHELIGTDFHSYFSDPEKARKGYQKVFKDGSVRDYELEIRHKDGHVTPVLYNSSIYEDEKGAARGVFTVARDISDRKRFEDQLVQAEKHAVIGRMVGSVTHEINNPLQTIKNCLYLIRQDVPPESPIAEPLDMASSETARLSDLVGQLRELYRPRTDLQERPHELLDIVEEVHALLTPHLNNSKVKWNPLTGLKRCYINCVRDQILEVFLNISMNAIEAMHTDGGTLSVDMRQEGKQVGVIFRDSGPGISAEILPHLFEPFMTTKNSGLGLGLSISYGIIQRHGGQIEVENNPSGGASFTVWLPVARKAGKEKKNGN